MLMTGGEGCGSPEHPDPDTPAHCPKMTDNEYRSEFTLYAIQGSPMLVGTDIRDMTPVMKELMLNREALEINQDWRSKGGDVVATTCGPADKTYLRRLSDGRFAVAVLNAESAAKDVTVCVGDFAWPHGTEAAVRDVWHQTSAATVAGKFTRRVEAHDTLLLILSKQATLVV
jgi:alpha-galactosidase